MGITEEGGGVPVEFYQSKVKCGGGQRSNRAEFIGTLALNKGNTPRRKKDRKLEPSKETASQGYYRVGGTFELRPDLF